MTTNNELNDSNNETGQNPTVYILLSSEEREMD
jgi:hypothetical protein